MQDSTSEEVAAGEEDVHRRVGTTYMDVTSGIVSAAMNLDFVWAPCLVALLSWWLARGRTRATRIGSTVCLVLATLNLIVLMPLTRSLIEYGPLRNPDLNPAEKEFYRSKLVEEVTGALLTSIAFVIVGTLPYWLPVLKARRR